jgi:MerR family transcriptional regulator, light-induced transcriptional regulator
MARLWHLQNRPGEDPGDGSSESGMRDSQHGGHGERDASGVSTLVQSVLSRLTLRPVDAGRGPDQAEIDALARSAAASDPANFRALRDELRRRRVSEPDLVDLYFPYVARKLGRDWADDRLGFAEVSIGLARLQAVLHDVASDWRSDQSAQPGSVTALLLLPEAEQHSFGAMVLMGQLRRRGVSVQLLTGARPELIHKVLKKRRFDCVMVSLACEERVEPCRKLVSEIRTSTQPQVRIAVGGAVMERVADLQDVTGADLATCDPDLALAGLVPALQAVVGGQQ